MWSTNPSGSKGSLYNCPFLENREWEEHLEPIFMQSLERFNQLSYVDVGANIGIHTLRAHRLGFKKIFCFEPDPITSSLLRLNCTLSGVQATIEQVAVGSECASNIFFNVHPMSSGLSSVSKVKLENLEGGE